MRSLKLLVSPDMALTPTGGVTFAHPSARLGAIRDTDKSIVEITSIPDDVDSEAVRRLYAGTADVTYFGTPRYSFAFDELGQGRIIRQ
jgi:hypothetical protein